MQLKNNKLANKIFIPLNIIVILLSGLIYHVIPPQFEQYIVKVKEDELKQLSQMLSKQSKLYLNYAHAYSYGVHEGRHYSAVSDMVKTELIRYLQINPDFVYYALIPKREGQSIEPLIYGAEKIGEAKELLTYETNEIVAVKKAGLLTIINPVFNTEDFDETRKVKLGYFISGFSLKDQEDELRNVRWALLFICVCFIILSNLSGYLLYHHINTPLKKSTELIKNVVQGDLSGMVNSKYQDELGNLIRILNNMVRTWGEKLEKIKDVIKSSLSVSSEISIAANQQEKITAEQASSINEVAATIEELNTNSDLIHKKAKEVERKSENLIRVSVNGQKSVDKTIEEFAIIQEYVKTIAEYILNLSEEAQQIGVILKEVSRIANQTDMLAINAGIKAAKVKDHGREFAIIATEMRDLANQSQASAAKISSSIKNIQNLTYSAVIAMEQGIKGVSRGIELILKAGKTIETAIINVKKTVGSVNEITLSSHQQFLGTSQVAQSVVSINKGMKETAISSKQTLRETEVLSKVHQELSEMISFYKI